MTDDFDDDDGWQSYKDDLAMGYIDRDGNQLDSPEPNCFDCHDTGVVLLTGPPKIYAAFAPISVGVACPSCADGPARSPYPHVAPLLPPFDDESPF